MCPLGLCLLNQLACSFAFGSLMLLKLLASSGCWSVTLADGTGSTGRWSRQRLCHSVHCHELRPAHGVMMLSYVMAHQLLAADVAATCRKGHLTASAAPISVQM
jgi:hypothetical protein